MGQERFNGFALLDAQKEIEISIECHQCICSKVLEVDVQAKYRDCVNYYLLMCVR